jgi:hypothetical protein
MMSIMDNEKVRNFGKRGNRDQGPQGSAGKKSG